MLQTTTWQLFLGLLLLLLGLRAYLRERRAGTWSWTKLGLLLLGILVIVALAVPWAIWLVFRLGRDQPALTVVLILVPIFAAVGPLAYLLRPKKTPPPPAPT
jgi:hypothetical protein